jgi:hypothetical protein
VRIIPSAPFWFQPFRYSFQFHWTA